MTLKVSDNQYGRLP